MANDIHFSVGFLFFGDERGPLVSLMIIQLAKMTLIVLAIFFTPAITRKFVFQLTAPEASQMMKWGGVMMGGLAAVGTKGLGIAKMGQSFGVAAARRELPAASHELTKIARRVSSSDFGKRSKLVQFSKNLVENQNRKLQDWHLNEHLKKAGDAKGWKIEKPPGKLSSFKEKSSSSRSALNESKVPGGKELLAERKDPISGRYIYPGQPKSGVLSASIRASDRAVQLVNAGTQRVAHVTKNIVHARAGNRIHSVGAQQEKQSQGGQASFRQTLNQTRFQAPSRADARREQFHQRVQSVMSQNKKRLDRIFKGDRK